MKKPTIKISVADKGAAEGERIVEVCFPDGKGCLVSLQTGPERHTIEIYRADPEIRVVLPEVPK